MKGGLSDQDLGRLTPDERISLHILASARGDDAEADRLERTAPVSDYRACRDRLDAARDIAIAVDADLAPAAAQIAVARAACEMAATATTLVIDEIAGAAYNGLDYEDDGARMLDLIHAAGEKASDWMPNAMQRIESTLQAEIAPTAQGFASFCQAELNADPKDLIAAFVLPHLPLVAPLFDLVADPEKVNAYQQFLTGIWRWRIGLEPDCPDVPEILVWEV